MKEIELQESVRWLIGDLGLLAFHCHDSRRSWGPGFPDLVIAGPGGLMLRELKDATGRLSGPQTRWRYALEAAGADWGLWRPSDLISGRIGRELAVLATSRRDLAG
jgi:hypothetical protein